MSDIILNRPNTRKGAAMAAETGKDSVEKHSKTRTHSLQVETRSRVEFKDITGVIQRLITESAAQQGTCIVFVPHTTAAVLVNENADPALLKDLDAHLKASIIGTSKSLFFENGRLVLGTWQGIFFCEFDGPRRRELRVKIISD
jgi:thiamine phosphate synthase YjbQ (UPF0047 family)